MASRAATGAAVARMDAQQQELDRRADWALGLEQAALAAQARADAAAARADALAGDVGRLDAQVHLREEHLAEAHGYYQRDMTDLARQRDVALSQRDQALAELQQVQHRLGSGSRRS